MRYHVVSLAGHCPRILKSRPLSLALGASVLPQPLPVRWTHSQGTEGTVGSQFPSYLSCCWDKKHGQKWFREGGFVQADSLGMRSVTGSGGNMGLADHITHTRERERWRRYSAPTLPSVWSRSPAPVMALPVFMTGLSSVISPVQAILTGVLGGSRACESNSTQPQLHGVRAVTGPQDGKAGL